MEELPIPEGCVFTPTYKEKRRQRSASYQHIYNEQTFNSFYEGFEKEILDDSVLYSEEREDVRDAIKERCWVLMKENLTAHQFRIARMLSGYDKEGQPMTQAGVGVLLGLTQSSITKCLFGNVEYDGDYRQSYGGIIKKMRRLSKKDEELLSLLQRLADLDELLT